MDIRTHKDICASLCGVPLELAPGRCGVSLTTIRDMAADDMGLVHGGFVFGMADYAAMLAVNDPNVVLGKAEMRFLKPVRAGETLRAAAEVREEDGRKRLVAVSVTRGDAEVASGVYTCFILDKHVLA